MIMCKQCCLRPILSKFLAQSHNHSTKSFTHQIDDGTRVQHISKLRFPYVLHVVHLLWLIPTQPILGALFQGMNQPQIGHIPSHIQMADQLSFHKQPSYTRNAKEISSICTRNKCKQCKNKKKSYLAAKMAHFLKTILCKVFLVHNERPSQKSIPYQPFPKPGKE